MRWRMGIYCIGRYLEVLILANIRKRHTIGRQWGRDKGCNMEVNSLSPSDAYMRQRTRRTLLQIMTYNELNRKQNISMEFHLKLKSFYSRKCIWKYRLWNGGHFATASMFWCLHNQDSLVCLAVYNVVLFRTAIYRGYPVKRAPIFHA